MKTILLPVAIAMLLVLVAPAPVLAVPTDPVCVQFGPFSVLGHQVVPYVYQCLPPI